MTAQDPANMSREQLAQLAAELSDVQILADSPKWPTTGAMTRAEKQAEWSVAVWFVLSALFAIAFVVTFICWPHEYVSPFKNGYTGYALYTPIIGSAFALAVLTLGIGMIAYIKKFFPDEVSVQQRHDGPSDELARKTVAAQYEDIAEDVNLGRRPLIKRAMLGAAGLFSIAAGILGIGGFVRSPWKGGNQAALWITGWKPLRGETVYLRTDTGVLGEIVRV